MDFSSTIIGIAGASGSGKSALTRALVDSLNASQSGAAVTLPIDAYYRDLSHLTFAERDKQNFDHPDALELELVADHLELLRAGHTVSAPVYDFAQHTRAARCQSVTPSPVIVVEGILAMAAQRLAGLYDVTVFVDTPLDVCLSRRIERDAAERGRDEASVRDFWQHRVLPMYHQFGERARSRATLLVDGTQPLPVSVESIKQALSAHR